MKAVQHFTPEYLKRCREMAPDQIIKFLDDFRRLFGGRKAGAVRVNSRRVTLTVPEDLLETFRTKVHLNGRPYQDQIRELMRAWVIGEQALESSDSR
jgi:predicted DNA binding CopG/RHH family protein